MQQDVRDFLSQTRNNIPKLLGTTTLSIWISFSVPTCSFLLQLAHNIYEKKRGSPVLPVIASAFLNWPTIGSCVITLLLWSYLLARGVRQTIHDNHTALQTQEKDFQAESIRIQREREHEVGGLKSTITLLQNRRPALEVKIKEVVILPTDSRSADCFIRIDAKNFTSDAPTTVHDMRLTLRIAGKDFASYKPLDITEYATATWEMDEDTGQEYTVEDNRLDAEENLSSTLKTSPLIAGIERRGWVHFSLRNLPPWPSYQEPTGEIEDYHDEEGEWHQQQVMETKYKISNLQELTLELFDIYEQSHFDKREGQKIVNSDRTVIKARVQK